MADSKKPAILLLKYLAFVCFVALSYTGLLYASINKGQNSFSYLAANIDKMRLLSETTSPKMIFIGGSNLAFGLDSDKMRQAFGMPVVNMGLHAGAGLKFMLDQVNPHLKHGDVVVVAPEYSHFVGVFFYGESALLELATYSHNMAALKSMSLTSLGNTMLLSNVSIFAYKPEQFLNPHDQIAYTRNWFNNYGDVITHLTLPNRNFSTPHSLKTDINQISVQYLHDFIVANIDRGVTTVVVYPCLQRSYYRNNASTVSMIAKALSEKGIHVSSTQQDFVYNDDLFFDTIYHLNARGRQLRTEKMIQVLSKALPKVLKQH
jgi:hypothetical protein